MSTWPPSVSFCQISSSCSRAASSFDGSKFTINEIDGLKLNSGPALMATNWYRPSSKSIVSTSPWIAILLYMFGNANFDQVSWFVWAIVCTYFVAFNTFPINMILQYKGVGKSKDYLYGKRTYIVTKWILVWLVLFGAMQP